MDYYYDNQCRRYLAQFLRVFSDIKVRSDIDENGFQIETRVPIKYGDMSRMIATIITGNTENTTIAAPAMAGYISNMAIAKDRRANTMFSETVQASEMLYDKNSDSYLNEMGNRYSVERYMPVPYDLTMTLDILTTNTDTKLQILEQILTIFNPSIQLQQNENPLDWTAIFEIELTNIKWSNRSIPVGANDDTSRDIASLEFSMQIWINPPAIEKRQRIIKNIVTSIYTTETSDPIGEIDNPFYNKVAQVNITPGNLKISVTPYGEFHKVQLLDDSGEANDAITWDSQIQNYGGIVLGTSAILLKTDDDIESTDGDIYATITSYDADPSVLLVSVDADTLPTTLTSGPINSIIDPTLEFPGVNLPVAATGQRYLIMLDEPDTNDLAIIPSNSHWGTISVPNNSIIEYTGSAWVISFNGAEELPNQYVMDLNDGQHYKFTGTEWIYTYLGTYEPMHWQLINLNIVTP